MHATQIADRAATLVPALNGAPLLADADTGYGNPLHAVWTALAYRRAERRRAAPGGPGAAQAVRAPGRARR
nr:hypothetical protein GCM10020092_035990 [Actinoplanes digitatis]